ncbi:MAG: acetylxylan esterase [Clostridia bacterium]|nr:acetylxylan esterase [Clostridia bacterium]
MELKRVLSVFLSICMVISMFTVLTLASLPVGAENTATVTTTAIHIGPSERYGANVPAGIFLPLVNEGKYGDGTIAHITAKVKMLNGTKPYVQMARAQSGGAGTTNKIISIYQASGISSNWNGNDTSSVTEGIFECDVNFKDIPGTGNCFYSDIWNGSNQTRKSDVPGRSQPIWGGIYIGNGVLNDNSSMHSDSNLSAEFIITDISVKIKTLKGGSGGKVGMELAPETTMLDEGKLYSLFAGSGTGTGNPTDRRIKNHPLQATPGIWSAVSVDEETVKQVTVADDLFDNGSHTYTKHAETDYEIEYYTCSDFGDTKFEKIGNCYSAIKDNDSTKKAFVLKSRAGETYTGDSGKNATYSNIFIPLNVHKFFSAYNATNFGCSSSNLKENSGNFKLKVSFNAKRLSGTGQPIVGKAYAYSTANSTAEEPRLGEPIPSPARAYNNDCGAPSETSVQKDYITSTYNASTGEFEAVLRIEAQEYGQISKTGISTYITIGQAEHTNGAFDAVAADSSFIISDIKFTVYAIGETDDVLFGGANQAPKMSAANCNSDTRYKFLGPWDNTDKVDGVLDVAMRHAPLNKFSVEGAVQNVSLIDDNICNRNCCTLIKHNSTDTTVDYYECTTHNKKYDDKFASHEITDITANRQMIVIDAAGNNTAGAFIPMDNDGWVGEKEFIFKCTMKLFGDEVPFITAYRPAEFGGIGTFYPGDKTSFADKDGVVTKWTHYDPATLTYTAAFSMWRADPKDNSQFKYYESGTGAHTAIMIGTYIPTSGQNPGVAETITNTAFAFTDPEIYEAADATTGTYTGENLCAPITDKTNTFTTSYKYSNCTQLVEGSGEWADRDLSTIMAAPLGKWSKAESDELVSISDIPEGYFDPDFECAHETTKLIPATVSTCVKKGHSAYTLCEDCGQKIGEYEEYPIDPTNHVGGTKLVGAAEATLLSDGYTGDTICNSCGVVIAMGEVIPATGDFGTKKMFTISPNNSGDTNYANVFIPLDFTETAGTELTGSCYFKLTFKAKLLGDQLPIVGVARYAYWNGGAQSEYNYANNNQKEHSDTVLMSSYDSDSLTFTAIIKLYLTNKQADTGIHSYITIGNVEHNDQSYHENNFQTYFSFTEPKLYAYDTTANQVYGNNLIMPVAEKTVSLDYTYKFGSNGYNAADSFVAAPANKWCIDTTASMISCTDIPNGYFDVYECPEGTPKMLSLAGASSSTNQMALNLETHLEANKTYQFDLDYRAFGGVSPYINVQTASDTSSGYSSTLVPYTNTVYNVDGAHRSIRFTMPSNARSGNNFKTYIGQKYPLKNTGVVYFANASLREVSGNTLGDNIFTNGDFHLGTGGTVNASNANTVLSGWGKNDILNYPSAKLMPIPDGFFSGTEATGDDTIALKMNGGDYTELQFKAELKPNTYYRLSFNYRNIGKMPTLSIKANGSVTTTKISTASNGLSRMTYELYSDETNTAYDGSGNDANTRIRLKFGASSEEKTLYINHISLFELSGTAGTTIGSNMIGNLNANLDSSYYSSLENIGDSIDVNMTQNGTTNVNRYFANGWFALTSSSDNASAKVVRIRNDFFNCLSYSEQMTLIVNALINRVPSDGMNPYYDQNSDSECNLLDLVRLKKKALYGEDTEEERDITVNGNPISQYRIYVDDSNASAASNVSTIISDYTEDDIQTTSNIPSDGKIIRVMADTSVSPAKCKVYVSGNTLYISAFRSEFFNKAVNSFATLLNQNISNFGTGYSKEFSIDTVNYSSATGTKSIISDSTRNPIGYSVGDTATIRIAAVDLKNAKILTGVSYFKLTTYNEATGASTNTYVTPTNGVYEFNVTANKAGYVYWYVLACDSSKNQISSFATVDDVSGVKYNFAGSVGFGVGSLSPVTGKPSNFNTYWQGVAAGIGSTSGATLTAVSANSGYNAYLVKIPCGTDINGNQGYATGYLTYPTSASSSSKIKMKITFQSYGVAVPSKTYMPDTAVFNMCSHSMDLTNSSSISEYESFRNSKGFNYTANTVEETYFYQMIRRDLTAAKFMIDYFGASGNNYWNGTYFEASGASMGGFQSTAVASLLKYATSGGEGITFLNIEIPYMCDMNGENSGRRARYWGARYTNTLKYFDTTYFGTLITCQTRIFAGLGDSICPSSGTMSLYNIIPTTDKSITYRQGATHSSYGSGADYYISAN